jgi:hypothetical protein
MHEANDEADSPTDDRAANVVVAMQRYLNLFACVEAAFHDRADEIAAEQFVDAAGRARECEKRFMEPLRVYARLLEQEYKRTSGPVAEQVYLFRLGELILLCRTLGTMVPELADLANEFAPGFATPQPSTNLATYMKFVKERALHD